MSALNFTITLGDKYSISISQMKKQVQRRGKKFLPKAVELVRGKIRIHSITTWDQYVQEKGKSQVFLK